MQNKNLPQEIIDEYAQRLHEVCNVKERVKLPLTNSRAFPQNGICITFEKSQKIQFNNSEFDRIVHIGYNKNNGNFPKRIKQFFVTSKSDATLKRHIGCALIEKANESEEFLNLWWNRFKKINSLSFEKQKEFKAKRKIYENFVYEHIQENMSFVIIPFDDHRLRMKNKILYTLSQFYHGKDFSSWLGNYSPNENIKNYGLWAEDYLKSKQFLTEDDFVLLENLLAK